MKLIIVLMTTVFLQISTAAEAQKITLSEKNASLIKIFKEIRMQAGYDFFADLDLLQKAKPITINIKDASIEEVLKICLDNQNLDFTISDKIIVIKKKKISSGIKNTGDLPQDSIIFKGRVTDELNAPMPGATVKVKGSKRVTKTDINGNFPFWLIKKLPLKFPLSAM
jgi:hypothetical protein